MKKNLLLIGCFLLGEFADAQVITYVGSNAEVTVLNGTLVYSGGGWENAANSKVDNTGNIMVVGGGSDVFTSANNGNFKLKMPSLTAYGQLFISGIPQAQITGKISKEYLADANGKAWQQAGIPFVGYTFADLQSNLGFQLQGSTRNDKGTAFVWNNPLARFDQISGNFGNPTDYTILPLKDKNGANPWVPSNASTVKTFQGVPVSDQGAVTNNHTLAISTVAGSYGALGGGTNAYHEWYRSYLNDPFAGSATVPSSWPAGGGTYGANLSQFANPFLTNLDLSNITFVDKISGDNDGIKIPNIQGISYYKKDAVPTWNPTTGTTYDGALINAALVGSTGIFDAGDLSNLFIKPMGEVMIKFKTNQTPNINLNNTRSFTARVAATYSPTGKGNRENTANIEAGATKQVAVVLYDQNNEELSRTYYAVSPSDITGYSNQSRQAYVEDLPIYTKEELPQGGEDPNFSYQLYINTANELDFAHKQVPLYINSNNAVNMTFELYEGGVKVDDLGDLPNGKSFYIERDGVVSKIQAGMTMPAAYGSYSLSYEEPEGTLATSNVVGSQTVVFRKGQDWVIRFAKDWNFGNVELYSITGQLLNISKKVAASQEYVIPVKSTGAYLVRITSDKGQIVTKKILK